MKKVLFISMLIAVGITICSCSNNNNTTVSTNGNENSVTNTNKNGPATGTFNASGTITFTSNGANYSCSISKVIAASTSLTIQTLTTDVRNSGSIVVTCYTATSAITTGTYKAPSSGNISSVTFIDKTVTPYTATTATAGSSCIVDITSLTSTSIKGTFTATVIKAAGKENINITNGVIDCTIGSK
jgi:hypothetical protein